MRYDDLGFPIPPQFDTADTAGPRRSESLRPVRGFDEPTGRAGPVKRLVVFTLLAAIVVPAVIAVPAMPLVREAVVQWSLDRAVAREGRNRIPAAIAEVGRAIDWVHDDPQRASQLYVWRAMLHMQAADPRGALADADQALVVWPTALQPRRVRALAYVVLADPDAALAEAKAAAAAAGADDPESLNHLAYVRALVGRELPEALEAIDRALASDGEVPEFLDTRGYVLHLLDRHQEAIDLLTLAITPTQQRRDRLAALAGRVDADELAARLRILDHELAVMYQHRGLACRAAGFDRQAEQDLQIAAAKGYAPERGVF